MRQNSNIIELKEQHIDTAAEIITRSFLNLNDIWKSQNADYDEVYPVLRWRIFTSVKSGWSFALLQNGQIVSVFIQLDMVDYLSMPPVPSNLKLFEMLGKYGRQVEGQLKNREWQRGQALYFMYGAIDPKVCQKGFCQKFWWSIFSVAKLSGYKYCYSRASHPASRHLMRKVGGKDIETVKLNEKNLPDSFMWLMEIKLGDDFPSFQQMMQPMARL